MGREYGMHIFKRLHISGILRLKIAWSIYIFKMAPIALFGSSHNAPRVWGKIDPGNQVGNAPGLTVKTDCFACITTQYYGIS